MPQIRLLNAYILAVCGLPCCLMAQASGVSSYDAAIQSAKAMISNNRLADGAAESLRAIHLNRNGWEAYALAGIAYAKMNDCPSAVPYFQSALSLAPDQNRNGIQSSLNACGGAVAQPARPPVKNVPPAPATKMARRRPTPADKENSGLTDKRTFKTFGGEFSVDQSRILNLPDGAMVVIPQSLISGMDVMGFSSGGELNWGYRGTVIFDAISMNHDGVSVRCSSADGSWVSLDARIGKLLMAAPARR